MKFKLFLVAGLVSMPWIAQAEGLYRWVDSSGAMHYSDKPHPDAQQVDTSKYTGPVSTGAELPYETARAQQNFPVTLYVSGGCAQACDEARALLNNRGIPFTEKVLGYPDLSVFSAR